MTPKEALEMLEKCGTNTEQPYEDMILEALKQSITELEELKNDVARFLVLLGKAIRQDQTREEMHERWELEEKFKKVGR